ncbi:MAG TPA: DinB family protein [Blastocatellia bacterium]|nr:DinB family protein [Blastocatellia bacterium]
MAIGKSMLPEFDYEMASTRKTLERVPDDMFDWKPHDKSMTMGGLATHLANLPTWASRAINKDSFDMAPQGGPPFRLTQAQSRSEVLDTFDKNVAEARAAIAGASDEALMEKWSLLSGGETVMTLPKVAVLRSFIMNHSIHHRGQLTVYLRLNDLPVPGLYGPSADEA